MAGMRFEVRYPGGAVHEVALDGRVAVVGRDPTSDLVINDPKCSRRHAVVESGPDGLVIRDSGSANGVIVNGVKAERSPLKPGDVFRIGDVEVAVLGSEPGTLLMDLGEEPRSQRTATLSPLEDRGEAESELPRPVPPAPVTGGGPKSMPPPSAAAARAREEGLRPRTDARWSTISGLARRRPLTVTVLAVLWLLSIPFHAITGFLLAQAWPGAGRMIVAALGFVLAVLGAGMAYGLWNGRRWARPAQIVLAAIGILNCPFALASLAVLVYMLRPAARRYFDDEPTDGTADPSEAVFAAALVAAVVLGGLVTAGLTVVARTARTGVEVGYKP
jgi:pSer/pThr/pTyr-binding forkhead associated (FHA) protein